MKFFYLEPKAVLVANDYALLRSRAVAGQAVTELPPFMANKEIAAGRLCAVLPSHPLPEQTLSLLYPSQRHPSRLVRVYLDFCQEQLTTYLRANVE
ncbi:LysR substrate-binding domain-containing protein [Serratia liquefaciens]|uniref:LysR substrate-binding domain-containing protein n=1 Tax=Serratia liquefaciens TaxID=614 RepID=UPI003966B675